MIKLIVVVLALFVVAAAQTDAGAAGDAKLIAEVKQVSVHHLDDALPDVGLERWLQKQSGADAQYHWEVNDCGEQSGTPENEASAPTCVEADSSLKDGRQIVVFISNDEPRKNAPPDWKIFFAQLATAHEKINLRRLSDLPAALTRTQ